MKTVMLKYVMKPGTKEKFMDEIKQLGIPEATRNEDGCLSYDFYISDDKDEIVLIEKWESDNALENHVKMPHLIKLREIKSTYGVETVTL